MASGNLILGTARRKLGDVVMYRRNGEQQARVRVRKISNPKSEGQALQRCYMAPVSKFYAPLAGVLERAWEGLDTSKSANAFMKANINLAREKGYYVVKGAGFTALPYKISKGIMQQLWYDYKTATSTFDWSIPGLQAVTGDITIAQLSAALVAIGFSYGDQISIIFAIGNDDYSEVTPSWCRFILSQSDQTTLKSLVPFTVDVNGAAHYVKFSGDVDTPIAAMGIIASRWTGKKWARSTQYMVCDPAYLSQFVSLEAREAAIASYRGGDSVVQSDVYLNGGTGSTQTEGSTYIKLYSADGASEIGGISLTEVVATASAGHPVLLRGVSANNGALYVVEVQDAVSGSATIGKFLDGAGQFTVESNDWSGTVKYEGADSILGRWIAQNGITIG